MKYIVILLILGFVDRATAAPIDIGVLAGITDSFFNTSDSNRPAFTPVLGFSAGVLAIGQISGSWQFRTGAYFTQRTAKVETQGETATLVFGYINLPLTALYRLDDDDLGVFAGPTVGIKTNSNCSGTVSICDADYVASANAQVLGAQIGVNQKFLSRWLAEIVYDFGLTQNSTDTKADAASAHIIFRY